MAYFLTCVKRTVQIYIYIGHFFVCNGITFSPAVAAKPKFVSKLRIAVVCSSNQNRSMEANNLLKYVH